MLAITASGLFLICVDLTVLYVALPALTRDLGASNSARLWILNAYPIVVAGLLPGLGTLGIVTVTGGCCLPDWQRSGSLRLQQRMRAAQRCWLARAPAWAWAPR